MKSLNLIDEALYTIDEVCKLLNVGRSTAYAIAQDPRYGCIKLSNSWRFPESALEEFIKDKQAERNK